MVTILGMDDARDAFWLSLNRDFPSTSHLETSSNITLATAPESHLVSPLFWTPLLLMAWIIMASLIRFRRIMRHWANGRKHGLFRAPYKNLMKHEYNHNNVDPCSVELGVWQSTEPPGHTDLGCTSKVYKAQDLTMYYSSSEPCLAAENDDELNYAFFDKATAPVQGPSGLNAQESLSVFVTKYHTSIAGQLTERWNDEDRSAFLDSELSKYFPFSDAVEELNLVQAFNPLRRKANTIHEFRQSTSYRSSHDVFSPMATHTQGRAFELGPESKSGRHYDRKERVTTPSNSFSSTVKNRNEIPRRSASCPDLLSNNISSYISSNDCGHDVYFTTKIAHPTYYQNENAESEDILADFPERKLKVCKSFDPLLPLRPYMLGSFETDGPSKRQTCSGVLRPKFQLKGKESEAKVTSLTYSNSFVNCYDKGCKCDDTRTDLLLGKGQGDRLDGYVLRWMRNMMSRKFMAGSFEGDSKETEELSDTESNAAHAKITNFMDSAVNRAVTWLLNRTLDSGSCTAKVGLPVPYSLGSGR